MYDMDTFIMSLRIGEKQSFSADQLPTQIGDLLVLLYCLLFSVHLKIQYQLLLILESLEFFVWWFGFFYISIKTT